MADWAAPRAQSVFISGRFLLAAEVRLARGRGGTISDPRQSLIAGLLRPSVLRLRWPGTAVWSSRATPRVNRSHPGCGHLCCSRTGGVERSQKTSPDPGRKFAAKIRCSLSACTRKRLTLFLFRLRRTPSLYPSRLDRLTRAAKGQRAGGNRLRDAGGGGDVAIVPHRDWRDQRGIAAHKNAVSDLRRVLIHAIVVAGNDAGSNVAAGTHANIAEIGQMIRLRFLTQPGIFGFDKVAHVGSGANLAAGTQVRKRSHESAVSDRGFIQNATIANQHTVANP